MRLIETFLNALKDTFVRDVELYIPYSESLLSIGFLTVLFDNPRVGKIIIHGSKRRINQFEKLVDRDVFFIVNQLLVICTVAKFSQIILKSIFKCLQSLKN
jgi:hypothetical protein